MVHYTEVVKNNIFDKGESVKLTKIALILFASLMVLAGCSKTYSGATAYKDISAHDPAFQSVALAPLVQYGFKGPQASCVYREALQVLINEMGSTYVESSVSKWRNSTQFVAGSSSQLSFNPNGTPFDPLYYFEGSSGQFISEKCDLTQS